MSFLFKLRTPLRVREIAEEKEERLLTQLLQKLAELQVELSTVQQQQADLVDSRDRHLRDRLSAAELQMYYSQASSLEQAEVEIKQRIAKCELARQEQTRAFQAAHQDREVLSELHVRAKEEFTQMQARRDQQAMEDAFISRRRTK